MEKQLNTSVESHIMISYSRQHASLTSFERSMIETREDYKFWMTLLTQQASPIYTNKSPKVRNILMNDTAQIDTHQLDFCHSSISCTEGKQSLTEGSILKDKGKNTTGSPEEKS